MASGHLSCCLDPMLNMLLINMAEQLAYEVNRFPAEIKGEMNIKLLVDLSGICSVYFSLDCKSRV